ncbi:MAG: DUF4197 domain-containing protein [Gammaproteobacteria bacterium]|nr:DUF4197 domain-containing protein [Gammaproteobacteria bacterium]
MHMHKHGHKHLHVRRNLVPLSAALAALLLTACVPVGIDTLQQDLTRAAQEQLKKTLASHYTRELGKGVTTVVGGLAKSGGYLDNPIARILLPPPLGFALGVARDLNADPQAKLLSVLMNQAAEHAIPGAAPIIQAALTQITPTEALQLLDGDKTAGTELLKDRTATILQAALAPVVTARLATSGAPRVYKELLEAYPLQTTATPAEVPVAPTEPAIGPAIKPAIESGPDPVTDPVTDLGAYVTQQAVAGMFNALGEQESFIRNNLGSMTGGVLQGMEKTPEVK